LTNLLEQIYDPASANYHHFLTPEEFTAQFGPTIQDYEMVVNFAKVNGLTVTGRYSNRMLLDVTGKAADIQNAFQVNLRVYHHPTENRDFFAPDREPSVPGGIADSGCRWLWMIYAGRIRITNLNLPASLPSYRPNLPVLQRRRHPVRRPVSGPAALISAMTLENAYVPRHVGSTVPARRWPLVEFDGYYPMTSPPYENLAVRTNIPLQNVLLDGFNGVPTGNGGGSGSVLGY